MRGASPPIPTLAIPRAIRAGHGDARLGRKITACRSRFHPDLLTTDGVRATDPVGEEVAEGGQATWIGMGFVVVRHCGRRARCLCRCFSAMETRLLNVPRKCEAIRILHDGWEGRFAFLPEDRYRAGQSGPQPSRAVSSQSIHLDQESP